MRQHHALRRPGCSGGVNNGHKIVRPDIFNALFVKTGMVRFVKTPGLPERYQGRDIYVSVGDAHESGSCDFGIRSWCEAVGLDYESGEAPLAMVLEGFRSRPQEEVRRAVLYAVRRHRAQRKSLDKTCDAVTATA